MVVVERSGATRRPVCVRAVPGRRQHALRFVPSSLSATGIRRVPFTIGGLTVVLSLQDAHVCLVDFDDDMSLFGVFDGHGGAEVAEYAVEMLPSLIKNELFEQGEYEKALIKAFMDFDDSLIEPPVLRRLRTIRLKNGKTEESGKYLNTVIIILYLL